MNILNVVKEWRRQPITLEQLKKDSSYPVLTAIELIDLLDQKRRLLSIYQLASVGLENYEAIYLPAIHNYIEACQLQPASSVHHHAGLGGLVVHTLEVVEYALKHRKRYLLPPNAEPERISREEHEWTYAVFSAALLHDAGKLLTLSRLKLDNKLYWTPAGPKLSDMDCNKYSIEFVRSAYDIQTRVSISMMDLLPPLGRNLLVLNDTIFKQLTAYLSGDKQEMGVLGKIVGDADRQSTGADIDTNNTQVRLSTVEEVPLSDLLISALRQLIHDKTLSANRSGAPVWYKDNSLYVVSNRLAKEVGAKLRAEGNTSVPNATGIFDNLQDAGYALKNSRGLSVHTIKVTGEQDEFEHELTVLKFEADRILPPQFETIAFTGTIEEVASKRKNVPSEATEQNTEATPAPTNKPAQHEEISNHEADSEPEVATTADETLADTQATLKAIMQGSMSPTPPVSESTEEQGEMDVTVEQPIATEPTPQNSETTDQASVEPDVKPPNKHESELARIALEINNKAANTDVTGKSVKIFAGACNIDHEDIAKFFMSWLKDGIVDGKLSLNSETSQVHIIPEGIAIVSPKIFKTFIKEKNLIEGHSEDEYMKAAKRVQNKLRKMKVLHLTPKNHAVHKIAIANSDSKLNAMIIQTKILYPTGAANLQFNSSLSIAQTFHA